VITGTCTIQATQPGNTTYAAAPVVSQSFAVNRVTQTITFANPGTQTYGTPLTLRATASSGLPVSFVSTTTSVCTVSGNSVTFLKAGFCGIEAKQLGYGGLTPATPIGQIFSVIRATQAITFPAIPSTPFSTGSITLNATASSGLTVTYTSTTSPVCTVSGNTVTLLTGGTCGIAATQPGNGDYAAAPAVGRIFSVTRVTQTITFPAIPSTPLSAGPITLAATASSGLPVTYVSTTPLVCTITASTANLLAAGTCGIEAKQLGNVTYQPATPLGRIFTVTAH
jgi:hypothetical protein